MKIIVQYALEIAMPSPNDRQRTSCVMISREKSRFVEEVHIPNAGHRPSAELLTELQKAEGSKPCLAKSKTSIQETGADTLSVFSGQACLFTQRTIPTTEKTCKIILANSLYGGAPPTAVSKLVT